MGVLTIRSGIAYSREQHLAALLRPHPAEPQSRASLRQMSIEARSKATVPAAMPSIRASRDSISLNTLGVDVDTAWFDEAAAPTVRGSLKPGADLYGAISDGLSAVEAGRSKAAARDRRRAKRQK